uniref:Protein MDT-30 n=1 Tax=Haemonchus contortus TaxID=6289 RepID=A0A7I4YEE9_HAECO
MQNNNPMGNPNMPPGGYPPPNQGQLHQQQPGMGYYGQPGPGQPQQPSMAMQSQQMMMGGGSSAMSMGYQGGVPQMMQQQPVQPNPPASMMQQAMFGAQGALSSARQPYSASSTNQPSGFSGSSSMPSMPMGGVPTQGPPSYPTQPQPTQQQQPPSTGFAGQQPQQSAPSSSQQGYAYAHGAGPAPTFAATSSTAAPGHSGNVNVHQASTHPTVPKADTKRPLNPPPYSPQILEHLDKFSVGTLTVIGRELVSELTTRTHSLCVSLKAVSERKPPTAGDPEQLLEYCQMLMDKLVEIRLRIEKKVGRRRLNTTDYIGRMSDMTPPVDDAPPELKEKRQQFEENRTKLCTLNNDLKMLDWMASVTDPSLLKKVDKMATSVRERE